jgi:hypothetical protein
MTNSELSSAWVRSRAAVLGATPAAPLGLLLLLLLLPETPPPCLLLKLFCLPAATEPVGRCLLVKLPARPPNPPNPPALAPLPLVLLL